MVQTSEYDDFAMVPAQALVTNPESAKTLRGKYRTLFDVGLNPSFANLEKAMNILVDEGWKPITMCKDDTGMWIIIENTGQVKRKSEVK